MKGGKNVGNANESLTLIVDPGKAARVVARVRKVTGLSARDVGILPLSDPARPGDRVAVVISQRHAGQGLPTRDLARVLRESAEALGA